MHNVCQRVSGAREGFKTFGIIYDDFALMVAFSTTNGDCFLSIVTISLCFMHENMFYATSTYGKTGCWTIVAFPTRARALKARVEKAA